MIQHIIPINDLREHSEKVVNHIGLMVCVCECHPVSRPMWDCPKDKDGEDNYIFVHFSYDGREGMEWANEILNQ